MKRWLYAVPVLAFLVLAFFLFHSLFGRPPDLLPSALIDKPAPDIGLAAMDDATPGFNRTDLAAGHVTVVNFFASWCVPCRMESAQLMTLSKMPGITLYGPPAERRAGVVSFNLEGIHPHDVAQILDLDAVAIRAGHHCCQPLMRKLGVVATNRASFYLYTVPEEIDQLVDGLFAVRKVFA